MLQMYIVLSYIIGVFMTHDSFRSTNQLTVIDVVMFFMSPFTITSIFVIKILSHFVDLNYVITTYEDEQS